MSEKEAIEIASEYAQKHGYDPDHYDASAQRDDDQWVVKFKGKKARPGNFFTVYLDHDKKTVTQLFPGK